MTWRQPTISTSISYRSLPFVSFLAVHPVCEHVCVGGGQGARFRGPKHCVWRCDWLADFLRGAGGGGVERGVPCVLAALTLALGPNFCLRARSFLHLKSGRQVLLRQGRACACRYCVWCGFVAGSWKSVFCVGDGSRACELVRSARDAGSNRLPLGARAREQAAGMWDGSPGEWNAQVPSCPSVGFC